MTQELLEILNESIGDASLLLTRHSPYLVQYRKPENLYIGVPNGDGAASFRRMNPSKLKGAIGSRRIWVRRRTATGCDFGLEIGRLVPGWHVFLLTHYTDTSGDAGWRRGDVG